MPSGKLAYFRSGGVGGTVDFTVTLDKASSYGFIRAFRPNDTSFSIVQVLVNGNLDIYKAEEGFVIFGVVITGAPVGTTVTESTYTEA